MCTPDIKNPSPRKGDIPDTYILVFPVQRHPRLNLSCADSLPRQLFHWAEFLDPDRPPTFSCMVPAQGRTCLIEPLGQSDRQRQQESRGC